MKYRRILFVYNTGSYLLRMRRELIVDLVNRGHDVCALFPFDGNEVALRALGVSCTNLSLTPHSLTPWRELTTIRDLRRKLRILAPDLVFAFTIKPIVYCGLCLPRPGPRFCVMITGLGMMFAGKGLRGFVARKTATALYRHALSRAAVVFMQNIEHHGAFRRLGLVRDNQVQLIAGSGVNVDEIECRPMPDGVVRFAMVTRLLEHKGIRDFVDAARRFEKQSAGVAATFELAGPIVKGPHALSHRRLAALLRDSPVNYLGVVEDVAALLARTTVVVLPSTYPEGVPRILLEALAVGRPIVTSDMPGCRNTILRSALTDCHNSKKNASMGPAGTASVAETAALASASGASNVAARPIETTTDDQPAQAVNGRMEHGITGLNGVLCPPGDSDALLAAMTWLAELPVAKRARMGEISRRLAESRFDVIMVNAVIVARIVDTDETIDRGAP